MRRLKELIEVLKEKPWNYILWLTANLGGFIIALMAASVVWVYHGHWGTYRPKPEDVLIAGTLSLAISGAAYLTIVRERSGPLLLSLSISWAVLLALVFSALVSMGAAPPVTSLSKTYLIAIVLASGCWIWSSILWLHQQGLERAAHKGPPPPPPPAQELTQAADQLPKLAQTPDERVST